MLDDLRNYLQMASGLTEATTSKAKDVVTSLLSHGISLSAKAIPAPEMMGQVQELADDLVNTSRNNREMLVGMIRAEVDRAVGRMGFVREDELAALRRHVQRLEKQLAELETTTAAAAPAATPSYPAQTYPATIAAPTADGEAAVTEPSAAAVQLAGESAASMEPGDVSPVTADGDLPVKKKKKKIVVDDSAGA